MPPSPASEVGDWLNSLRNIAKIRGDNGSPVIEESNFEALRD